MPITSLRSAGHLRAHVCNVRTLTKGRRCLSTTRSSTTPRRIFSGIQPTGVPHLGNYLGALQQWVKLQDEADTTCLFSIVDLHSITVPQSPERLRQSKRETLATLLAVGLDPERSTIFYQSTVSAHSELMWILSCQASVGYLSRMTQWKSKLDVGDDAVALDPSSRARLKLGLFSYPVLQAADILLHRATHVPVGEDQSQHLEFARDCANGFNSVHGNILVEPSTLISPAKRIMALDQPKAKMSKSHASPRSRIMLTDTRDDIRKKVSSALTDSIDGISYDPCNRPGVSNLVEILYHLRSPQVRSIAELASDYQGLSLKAFKSEVIDAVDSAVAPIRERISELLNNGQRKLDDVARCGQERAEQSASETMVAVRRAIGLA